MEENKTERLLELKGRRIEELKFDLKIVKERHERLIEKAETEPAYLWYVEYLMAELGISNDLLDRSHERELLYRDRIKELEQHIEKITHAKNSKEVT